MKLSARMACSLLAFSAAAFFFFASTARAQEPAATAPASTAFGAPGGWRGFYVGGGGTYSNVSVQVGHGDCHDGCYWGDYYNYDQGDGDYGYSLHAGWRMHRF